MTLLHLLWIEMEWHDFGWRIAAHSDRDEEQREDEQPEVECFKAMAVSVHMVI